MQGDEREASSSEDEMPATERELADDAQWKLIQKNTFTRWANEHLKTCNKHIGDLDTDLGDGLRLIALVEVLSGRKFTRFTKRPVVRPQKLENVTMALNFLQKDEGIKIVTIDSGHIVDGSPKLILGLMWTLILHYSISMPMWEEDEFDEPVGREKTPKQRLLAWVQNKIPEAPITNFTRDWNDGRAIGALVDAIAPGLCPDWEDWEPKNAFENAKEAMDAAEQWLNVPQLIKPEEMTNPKIDEKCMMTYLSQFPNAKLKPGAPLRPRTNPKKVRAFGPGIEPTGNSVGAIARFTIETFSAGKGSVEVIILNPKGQQEKCEVLFNNDRNLTYSCSYTPTMEGNYKVIVKFATKEIPRSPFTVTVEGQAGDASKVTAVGPGIERTGNMVGKRAHFEVFTKKAGFGNIEIVILDPHGRKDIVKPKVTKTSEDTYLVEYMPKEEGLHSVSVFFAGSAIPKSPFGVGVAPPCNPSKVYATGRGIQPKGVRVRDVADFQVHTEGAGDGELKVHVTGPGGVEEKVIVKQIDKTNYECVYTPLKTGEYTVMITYAGANIPKSPFRVDVAKASDSKIRAYGPGLETGVVGCPCDFTVETNNETGALGKPLPKITTKWFSIEGPSQAKIDCNDNGDGSADISYYPTIPGEYAVHILCNESDIPGSPFMAQIVPATADFNPTKVKAYGPGLEKTGVEPNRWAEFTVDCREAGTAPLKITCVDAQNNPIEVQVADNRNNTYSCRYIPKNVEKHTIYVSYGGCNIPNSPFRMSVGRTKKGSSSSSSSSSSDDEVYVAEPSKPSKVKVYGPGLEKGVRMHEPTYFIVDCKEAGPGDVAIALTDEKGNDVPVSTTDNKDGTFTIQYEPNSVGTYTTGVFFAEQEIPSSPYKVQVEPHIDVSQVYCDGLQQKSEVGKEYDFDIITADAGGKAPTDVIIIAPSGKQVPVKIEEIPDGYIVKYTLEELGTHSADVIFNNQSIPNSPFKTEGVPKGKAPTEKPMSESAKKVKAYGPGLSKGVTGAPAEFTIDTREAGPGGLGLTIEGPAEAKIDCSDNGDGTCGVKYYPLEPGEYTINILFADEYIPKSPYKARVVPPGKENLNVSGVKTYGPGVEREGVFLESPTDFTVDARSVTPSGDGKVKAILTNPQGTKYDTIVKNHQDGTYNVSYTPFEQGVHTLDVTYDGIPVPGSPFNVNVVPGCDVTRVKAYGPGLEGGNTNIPQVFTVETRGAGQGGLGLAIEGPSEAKMTCRDNRDGSCAVEYHPTKPGDYDISVKFADEHIPGSPFHVSITDKVDAKKAKAFGPGLKPEGVRAGVPAEFTVDAREAGVGFLDVAVVGKDGKKKPGHIKPVGDGTYECSYVPEVEGPCQVEVKYGDEQVPKSPFKTKVLPKSDASKVKVVGDGVKPTGVPASLPVSFTVDTKEAGVADLGVEIQNPEGLRVTPEVLDNADGTFTVSYTPEEVGQHTVDVKFDGKPVPKSPFKVKTSPSGHPEKCKIIEGLEQTVILGEETVITINTADAGKGAITCKIRNPTGGDCDIDIEDNADGTVSIYYTPRFPGTHSIAINFGGKPIPKGEFTQETAPVEEDLISASSAPGVHSAVPLSPGFGGPGYPGGSDQFRPVDFCIPVGPVFNSVSADIIMPSGKVAYPKIEDNKDGTVTIRYTPEEVGTHEMNVRYNNQAIQGSPFKFHVDAVSSGYVTAYGPGLSHGVSGEPCHFTINTKHAGAGGLALAVEGPSKSEIRCKDNKDGTCSVTYYPTCPGEYKIIVKFADQHISGSPFTAKITGNRQKKAQISVGSSSEVSLKVTETDISTLKSTIKSPSGREEPCILKRLANGHLGISFTPKETGQHLVNVFRDGKHIPNSPFKIHVGESELGNASKVKVHGKGLHEGMAGEKNDFVVDTKAAGYGGLSLSIEGPSKADIECEDNEDGTCKVSYKPTEPGTYIINVKFADEHVPGSPFPVHIGGESHRLTEHITSQRRATEATHVGSQCELSLKIPGTSPFDMNASVTSPSGQTELCEIKDLDDCHYSIKFVPKEMGVHTVSVKHKDLHIPGSPFQFTVGPITEGGAHKVHAGGPGLESGEVSQPADFNIYTREAGAGGLSIAVEGPSKAEIKFEDRKDGSCGVSYHVTEPGDYLVSVKFNDEHIPDSPFKVPFSPENADARKLNIIALQEKGLQVGRPAAFTVDFNGAHGTLTAYVVSPSGAEEEAIIQELDDDKHAVRFIPKENGAHYVHVRFNDTPIQGSPFRLLVGKCDADPGMVHASGEGLVNGKTDHPCRFIVDTCNAGSGALSVTIDGPSKVKLDCKELANGYGFTYVPTAPGDYLITIKYAGNYHVVGSPFKAHITGTGKANQGVVEQAQFVVNTEAKSASESKIAHLFRTPDADASKVICKGLGLKKAFVKQQAQFTVDTKDAGTNVLMVGILGPGSKLCEEICIKHQGRQQYKVDYLLKERGDYLLIVKWGDDHVPGSPYAITV
ncbi:filamin-A-like isoform X7 [Lineus longissimus]|uniref:filamin-A-like isoform X7 n=1 Tax=Lineus longissimus TaxID=88925 RepID=UPI00315C62D9